MIAAGLFHPVMLPRWRMSAEANDKFSLTGSPLLVKDEQNYGATPSVSQRGTASRPWAVGSTNPLADRTYKS
jgi:hypothetical protein